MKLACIKIEVGSREWLQTRKLRHQLFFEGHGLPESVMDDGLEEKSNHIAIKSAEQVVAYGRMTPIENGEFIISQMVVETQHQGLGYGNEILNQLIKMAIAKSANIISLDARLTAVGFYEKFEFQADGAVFNSKSTGVPHIKMKRELIQQ